MNKLKAIFYPDVKFETLFIPHIYREIYFENIYADVFKNKEPRSMTIIDVGANIGIVAQYMQPFAKKLYALEPSDEHFEALAKNKEFNNWDNVEVFKLALADKDGEMNFAQNTQNRTMNSLMVSNRHDRGTGKHILYDGISKAPMVSVRGYDIRTKVPTKSFDHFFAENNITHVDFIKFDTEGAEDLILRSEGFRKVAHMIDAIEVEFHFKTWMELVEYLTQFGFKTKRLESSAKVVLFFR
jgi:FkbM family methyltransferase